VMKKKADKGLTTTLWIRQPSHHSAIYRLNRLYLARCNAASPFIGALGLLALRPPAFAGDNLYRLIQV
jgi:hypothetical protein